MTLNLYAATTRVKAGLLSLALVHPDGRWFYAETTDIMADHGEKRLYEGAQLKRVPGATFVRQSDLSEAVALFLDQTLDPGVNRVRLLLDELYPSGEQTLIFSTAASQTRHALQLGFEIADLDKAVLHDLVTHCAGVKKVEGHALITAMKAALCDPAQQTDFYGHPFHRFELLMGTKRAFSFRAWVRERERSMREALGQTVPA